MVNIQYLGILRWIRWRSKPTFFSQRAPLLETTAFTHAPRCRGLTFLRRKRWSCSWSPRCHTGAMHFFIFFLAGDEAPNQETASYLRKQAENRKLLVKRCLKRKNEENNVFFFFFCEFKECNYAFMNGLRDIGYAENGRRFEVNQISWTSGWSEHIGLSTCSIALNYATHSLGRHSNMDIHWLAIINSFVLMLLILPGSQ